MVPFSDSSSSSARRDVKPVVKPARCSGWVRSEGSGREDDDDDDDDGDDVESVATTLAMPLPNTWPKYPFITRGRDRT